MNLAINARDAMPRGGKLTLETADVRLDESYAVQHAEVTPGEYVMLAVSDTGIGMTQRGASRTCSSRSSPPRSTAPAPASASPPCYGIVRQSGGHLWVYSEPDRGTTFKIYFPAVDAVVPAQQDAQPARTLLTGTETILLVGGRGGRPRDRPRRAPAVRLRRPGGGHAGGGAADRGAIRGSDPFAGDGRNHAAHERPGAVPAAHDAPPLAENAVHLGLHGIRDDPAGNAA